MSAPSSTEPREGQAFILILIFFLMSIGVISTGYFYYRDYEQKHRVNMESQLSSISQLKTGEIALWREERLADGMILSKNTAFSALVRRFFEKPGDVDAQRRLLAWMGDYVSYHHYMDISLYDTEGTLRIMQPDFPEMVCSEISRNVAAILKEGRVVIQDFHREAPDSPIHLAVIVPILDEADVSRPLGVLVMDIDPAIYLYPFITRWSTPSQTAESLLIRKDGDDALFLNELKFKKNSALNLRIPLAKTDVPAVKAALGQSGIVEGLDYSGMPVIADLRAVPDSPWRLVVKMNTSEIYAPLRERMWLLSTVVGVLLIGAALSMGFIWRQRDTRFYRKQYEAAEAVRQSERTLRKIIEEIPIPIAIASADGAIDYLNQKAIEILGYSLEDIPDIDHWWKLAYPDETYRAETIELWTRLVKEAVEHDREIEKRDYLVTCKDRSARTFAIFGIPLEGKVFVMFYDLTERKKAEDELRAAKAKAEDATRLKDKFVALVAHDLRSPFASMMGLLHILGDRKAVIEDTESQNVMDRVFKNGDRMVKMIDQLLNISRLQTGKIVPNPRFFKAHMAAAVTIGAVNHSATEKGVVIINEVPVDMRLYADSALFDEALINFLSNAIKFCSSGDKITVFAPKGLNSAIAVQDTGKGIEPAAIPNLFKHEVTTSTRGTAGEMGTGLGLPFSLDIMKAHGGDISVESEPGKGSVFCAILPHVRPLALVVDDDLDFMPVIRGHLEKIGVDVAEAFDAEQALSFLKERRPHIIIIDIMMPVMDGYTLLGLLKKDSATMGIPVVVMTIADRDAHEKAIRCGADDFVSKPLDADDFIPRVRRFVG